MSGYVFVDTKVTRNSEWTLEIGSYRGDVTAEEFAARHNLIAVNDNADESELTYIFIGSRENVIAAFDAYTLSLKNS